MILLKRIFCLFIVFCVILLPSCKNNTTPIINGFSCKANVKVGEDSFKYFLEIKQNGEFSATVLSDDELNGLKYIWNGKNFIISYKEINKELEQNSQLKNSFAYLLKTILSQIEAKSLIAQNGEIKGTDTFGSFTVSLRPDGFIKKIEIDSLDISAEFYSLQYLF